MYGMKIYYWVMGSFCLLYYLIICIYSRKWNSTFTLFWPAAGGIHLLLGSLALDGWAGKAVVLLIAVLWAAFLMVEFGICKAMTMQAPECVPFLIVLGAQVRGTKITNSLMRRLDASISYLKENPGSLVIVSGGQGKGELVSEAEAMAGYLRQHGIGEHRIIQEGQSTSTWENLKFSSSFIDDMSTPVAIVTNNFHMYRAILIGKKVGFQNVYGIAASANWVFQLNYLVREFFAVIWIKLHSK